MTQSRGQSILMLLENSPCLSDSRVMLEANALVAGGVSGCCDLSG